MKIQNVGLDNAYAIVRGWVSDLAAAATGLISVTDETTGTTVGPVASMTLVGQLINDGGSGNLVVDIQAVLTEYTNNSGVDLIYGDVVVLDSTADTAVTTTTTAQDTRPVGIVLANIGAGGAGPVQTGGVVQLVNVTAAVTRGEFAETSTTAKKATQNPTARTGSFGLYLESGTTPTVLLFGYNTVSAAPVVLTVSDGSSVVVAATEITTAKGGVTDLGSSDAGLNLLTSVYGGQDKVVTVSASGASYAINCATGNVFDITLTANCTFTITNPPASGVLGQILVVRRQGGSGSYTETWPASVKWRDASGGSTGSAPTLFTAVGAEDVVELSTVDGGTTWGGTPLSVPATGTVTSVALTVPAEFAIGGSPITTSGTLAITKATETANTVWAGPISGAAAQPTFRALVAGDIGVGVAPTDHEHIMNLWFSGDGATTAFELPAAAFDSQSVRVWVSGTLTDVTLSGAMLTTMTFGSAPASATNNIVVDLVAAIA